MRCRVGLFLFISIFLSSNAFAQDDIFLRSNKNEPENEGTEAPSTKEQPQQELATATEKPAHEDDLFGNLTTTTESEAKDKKEAPVALHGKVKESLSAEEDERAIPVTGIGLIVEADGSEKLRKTLNKYYELTRNRPINPALVYVVMNGRDDKEAIASTLSIMEDEINRGDDANDDDIYKAATDGNFAQQLSMGFQNKFKNNDSLKRKIASAFTLVPTYYPPPMYPIKQMPSWYLITDQGQIILEGLEDPSPLLTKSGKFVAPLGVTEEEVQAAPTNTPAIIQQGVVTIAPQP